MEIGLIKLLHQGGGGFDCLLQLLFQLGGGHQAGFGRLFAEEHPVGAVIPAGGQIHQGAEHRAQRLAQKQAQQEPEETEDPEALEEDGEPEQGFRIGLPDWMSGVLHWGHKVTREMEQEPPAAPAQPVRLPRAAGRAAFRRAAAAVHGTAAPARKRFNFFVLSLFSRFFSGFFAFSAVWPTEDRRRRFVRRTETPRLLCKMGKEAVPVL